MVLKTPLLMTSAVMGGALFGSNSRVHDQIVACTKHCELLGFRSISRESSDRICTKFRLVRPLEVSKNERRASEKPDCVEAGITLRRSGTQAASSWRMKRDGAPLQTCAWFWVFGVPSAAVGVFNGAADGHSRRVDGV